MKLLRFSAAWCGPCRILAPLVDKFAADHGLAVEVVDCTRANKVADKYEIQALPTVLFISSGRAELVLARVVGAEPREAFDKALERANRKLLRRVRAPRVRAPKAGRKFRSKASSIRKAARRG